MHSLDVQLPYEKYSIYIETGILDNIGEEIARLIEYKKLRKKVLVITDFNVDKLYGNNIRNSLSKNNIKSKIIYIEPGEKSKSIKSAERIYNELLKFEMTRQNLIIAFGGGVVGDLGGFVASTFMRGIPFIQVPTTLLAQVDSSIGGKVAVNLPMGKNLVGSFYHPKAVYIDSIVLNTLENKYFYDGIAEVIKYGCIKDKGLFGKLKEIDIKKSSTDILEQIVYKCCNIKGRIVEEDEKDTGERMILNFGHTIGHAIEKVYNYEKYTHGEAVAIGMYTITKKSEEMGLTEKGTANEIKKLLIKYNLSYELPKIQKNEIIKAMKSDKKNSGEFINLVLLRKIGEAYIKQVKFHDIKKFI